eukprot:SAG31_NODE_3033_length_4764_cov_1.641372_2_plen_230_part_00
MGRGPEATGSIVGIVHDLLVAPRAVDPAPDGSRPTTSAPMSSHSNGAAPLGPLLIPVDNLWRCALRARQPRPLNHHWTATSGDSWSGRGQHATRTPNFKPHSRVPSLESSQKPQTRLLVTRSEVEVGVHALRQRREGGMHALMSKRRHRGSRMAVLGSQQQLSVVTPLVGKALKPRPAEERLGGGGLIARFEELVDVAVTPSTAAAPARAPLLLLNLLLRSILLPTGTY